MASTITVSVEFLDGKRKTSTDQEGHVTTYTYGTHQEAGGGTTATMRPPGSGEQTTEFRDLLGRTFQMTYADGAAMLRTYYSFAASVAVGQQGRLQSVTEPDGITTTYRYNTEGERTTTISPMPMASDGSPQERVNFSETDSVAAITIQGVEIAPARRTTVQVNGITTAESYRSVDGRLSGTISFARESLTETTVPVDGAWASTVTNLDGTKTVSSYDDGLMVSTASYPSGVTPDGSNHLERNDYTHDSFGRVLTQAHSRTGIATMGTYLDTGALLSVTDAGQRTTSFSYDKLGRRLLVDAPDTSNPAGGVHSNITYTSYYPDGQTKATWGGQVYPRFYEYDEQNRMTKLHTWQSAPTLSQTTATAPAGSAVTTWLYNNERGWLTQKLDADGKGASYTYTAAGRLETRTWARGVVTTYDYDEGQLANVTYSNETNGITTPNLAYRYDDFGRLASVTRAGVLHASYAYDSATLQLVEENLNQDTARPQTLTRYHDSLLRPLSVAAAPTASLANTFHTYGYQYDSAGRLGTVRHEPTLDQTGVPTGGSAYDYQYVDGSASLLDKVTGPHHAVSNAWDPTRNVLLTKRNHNLAGDETFSQYTYTVNELGQRTSVAQSGNAFSENGLTESNQSLNWSYDALGQVVAENHSEDSNDNAYRYDTIGNRTHDVHGGLALPTAPNFSTNAVNEYTVVPQAVTPSYDDDGNMLTGPVPGRNSEGTDFANATNWLWDAENRLRSITINGSVSTFDYDYLGRRIAQVGVVYLYDGWNVLTYQLANQSVPTCTYTWGIDLSGTMQGAGGVGGLLVSNHVGVDCSALYDGNGNATQYRSDSGYEARWEYDAFGRTTWTSADQWSNAIFHRFSTKPSDHFTTGLYYYGYRYYDPVTGRWPSRDPIGERGGANLYGFVGNDGLNQIDRLGLSSLSFVTENLELGYCGSFLWKGFFDWRPEKSQSGVILQEVLFDIKFNKYEDFFLVDPEIKEGPNINPYHEVWETSNLPTGQAFDTFKWRYRSNPLNGAPANASGQVGVKNSKGRASIKGWARYYPNIDLASKESELVGMRWSNNNPNTWAGVLLSGAGNPGWLSAGATASNLVEREIVVKWDCCGNEENRTELVSITHLN